MCLNERGHAQKLLRLILTCISLEDVHTFLCDLIFINPELLAHPVSYGCLSRQPSVLSQSRHGMSCQRRSEIYCLMEMLILILRPICLGLPLSVK